MDLNIEVKQEKEDNITPEAEEVKADDVEVKTEGEADAPYIVDEGPVQWSHEEAMTKLQAGLTDLIKGDSLLCDLPDTITLEEINLQIALEYGQAMTVYVWREDGLMLPVVVVQNGTVLDLKKAIQRHFKFKQSREGGTQHISWRYIWRAYLLVCQGEKLLQDNKPLREYGIRNNSEVSFQKRLRNKNSQPQNRR